MENIMETTQTALVTGASGGIGEAFARLLADKGYDLILVARREERLVELAQELESLYSITVWPLPMELADPESPREIFRAVTSENWHVDLLVNNAGYGTIGNFSESNDMNNSEMIQVMLTTLTSLARLFIPPMVEKGTGGIINVGSTASLVPCPNMAVYGAIKAYVASFSEALSYELRKTGVTVTALLPGNTSTGFSRRAGTESTLVARFNAMSAEAVARIGYRALQRGRSRVVAGCFNALQMAMVPFMPRCAVNRLTSMYLT
jgi:short-subunit dehydrogenase